jgi:hypothetical protein
MSSTATERSQQSRAASHIRWAKESDPTAATAPARKGFDARFERQLDEWGITDPADRARRIGHLRKAYFADLARKSAVTRRTAGEATKAKTKGAI